MNREVRSPLRLWLAGIVALAAGIGIVSLLPGCGKPPPLLKNDQQSAAAKVEPWVNAGKRLRKDSDAVACKLALTSLNVDLQAAPDAPKPSTFTPQTEKALADLVPLNPEDQTELRDSSYTSHDSAYLAECLYMRDAARSLDVPALPGQTPDQIATDVADRGFAWVCRSVYLNPWVVQTPDGFLTVSVPPTYVLRRGYGSGLERMYVFLALLQQMGLDGCLVGPPDAGDKPAPWPVFSADKKTLLTGAARGPFWAVGVRIGNDVRLYDPWRGQVFPAQLNAFKANPDASKTWIEDKANVSGLTAEEAKKATVYLAVPVNSLAPRMSTLEQQLKADIGAKVAIDAAALRNAFPDPKPAFWNPPGDSFAYGRVLRMFLPADEGGSDRRPPGGRAIDQYLRSQIPEGVGVTPVELRGNVEAAERIRNAVAITYGGAFFGISGQSFFAVPTPRERIQRGQFQDASSSLVTKQDQFAHGLERLRNNQNADNDLRTWATEARALYNQQGLATTPEDRQQKMAAVENHWRQNAVLVQLMVDRVSAELGHAEATFLMALCKHEQAERVQTRLEHATGAEAEQLKKDAIGAWQVAHGEWQTYAERARAQAGFPGRAAYVQTLAARAEKMANQK
ncbi:MAG: hypothetical protein K8U57_05895 [Planctomycetes bacterium]|nr:hypothetical protein [Planctomycetota bacterium]